MFLVKVSRTVPYLMVRRSSRTSVGHSPTKVLLIYSSLNLESSVPTLGSTSLFPLSPCWLCVIVREGHQFVLVVPILYWCSFEIMVSVRFRLVEILCIDRTVPLDYHISLCRRLQCRLYGCFSSWDLEFLLHTFQLSLQALHQAWLVVILFIPQLVLKASILTNTNLFKANGQPENYLNHSFPWLRSIWLVDQSFAKVNLCKDQPHCLCILPGIIIP